MFRVIASAVGLLCLVGCATHHAPTFERPVAFSELASGLPTPTNDFQLVSHQASVGRFACGLALAKLTVPPTAGQPLQLVASESTEQAWWTEQLRGVTAIRELIFLRPTAIRGDGEGIPALCAAARTMAAPLLLVYVPNHTAPYSAQVLGVIYDAETEQPLATLHAAAKDTAGAAENDDDELDAAPLLAARQFERNTLGCLSELTRQDSASPTTQPHQWQQPLIERWWLNRR